MHHHIWLVTVSILHIPNTAESKTDWADLTMHQHIWLVKVSILHIPNTAESKTELTLQCTNTFGWSQSAFCISQTLLRVKLSWSYIANLNHYVDYSEPYLLTYIPLLLSPRFFIGKITKNTKNLHEKYEDWYKIWDWHPWRVFSRSRMGFIGWGDTVRDRTPLPGDPTTPWFFLQSLSCPGCPRLRTPYCLQWVKLKSKIRSLVIVSRKDWHYLIPFP